MSRRQADSSAAVKRPMGQRMHPSQARVRTLCALLRVSIIAARIRRTH